jgi:4-diphosphocytidyl-2-C-methyl-D-erythritol kinase
MAMFKEPARAKVNLTLRVLGRRTDGFHELESLVVFADEAADQLSLDSGRAPGVTVTGPFATSILGENLIAVTLARIAAAAPHLRLGHVTLDKRLPIAAGIGGGSADAAAVLRLVRRANPESAARIDWMALARSLGADVPVCLANGPAWMTGLGEELRPVPDFPLLHAVLVNPLVAVPADKTARVFRALAAPALPAVPARHAPPVSARELPAFIASGGNDLAAAARTVVPQVDLVETALTQTGASLVRLSGGGPTCFGLYDSAARAVEAAASVSRAQPRWWVVATTLGR